MTTSNYIAFAALIVSSLSLAVSVAMIIYDFYTSRIKLSVLVKDYWPVTFGQTREWQYSIVLENGSRLPLTITCIFVCVGERWVACETSSSRVTSPSSSSPSLAFPVRIQSLDAVSGFLLLRLPSSDIQPDPAKPLRLQVRTTRSLIDTGILAPPPLRHIHN